MQSVQKRMDFITNYKPFTTRPLKDFLPWLSSVDERIAKENILSTRLVDVLRLAAGVLCRKKSLITKTLRVHLSLQRRGYSSSIFKSCFTKMATMWALPAWKPPKQINLKAAAFSRNCTIRCNAGVENCQINVWSTTNSRSIRKNGTVRFLKKILWLTTFKNHPKKTTEGFPLIDFYINCDFYHLPMVASEKYGFPWKINQLDNAAYILGTASSGT